MKTLLTFFILLFSSSVVANEVEAISLSDLLRDYTIVNPMNKVVYGEIKIIEKEIDAITDEVSVGDITIRSNGDNYNFNLSDKVEDIVMKNIDIFKEGLEIAFRLGNFCSSRFYIDYGLCNMDEIFMTYKKIPHEVPNIERPQEITVEDYFLLGVLYQNLPLKITGVLSSKQINKAANNNWAVFNIMELTTPEYSNKKITCMVNKSFLSEDEFIRLSRIINKSNVGDQVTCEGVFSGGFMNACMEQEGWGYFLCTSEISIVNKK
ncbi:hypothetical protein OAJ30_01115 [Alphaproteobacteria bacterium]|nr:hypothetical protein [Alphaproteobacteria bacterium]